MGWAGPTVRAWEGLWVLYPENQNICPESLTADPVWGCAHLAVQGQPQALSWDTHRAVCALSAHTDTALSLPLAADSTSLTDKEMSHPLHSISAWFVSMSALLQPGLGCACQLGWALLITTRNTKILQIIRLCKPCWPPAPCRPAVPALSKGMHFQICQEPPHRLL